MHAGDKESVVAKQLAMEEAGDTSLEGVEMEELEVS